MFGSSQFINKYPAYVIAVLIVFGIIFGYLSGFFFENGILPCFPPPGIAVDGIAIAKSFTWNDFNSNGHVDEGEPPLAWVTIGLLNGDAPSLTGADGIGVVEKFIPGCICWCWINEEVFVSVPPGFNATTPIQLGLTGENDTYNFGFIVDDSFTRTSFPGEPDWYQAFINRGLVLSEFHYSELEHQIMMAFSTSTEDINRERDYQRIFEIIDSLNGYSNIGIERFQMKRDGDIASCELDIVKRWEWKIPYEEIIDSYCD